MPKGILVVCAIFAILLNQTNAIGSIGTVDYNDECEFMDDFIDPATFTSRLEYWKYCDTERGLHCVPGLGRCGCVVPHTIYRKGKCRAKINHGCLVKEYKLDCVEYATCTRNDSSLTFRCRCDRGYLANAENTACFSTATYQRRYGNYYRDGYYYFGSGTRLEQTPLSLFVGLSLITLLSCR